MAREQESRFCDDLRAHGPCLPTPVVEHGCLRVLLGPALAVPLALGAVVDGQAQSTQPEAGDTPEPPAAASTDSDTAKLIEAIAALDRLLAGLDARIEEVMEQADSMLAQADASKDPGEQLRYEGLYGRFAALAESLEAERAKLVKLREDLVASAGRLKP